MTKKSNKNVNFQFAISVAEGFYQTGLSLAKHTHTDDSKHGYIWIPTGVVNFSFATELLLKATIYYDTEKQVFGHELFKLYQTLTEKTKKEIEKAYKSYKSENEKEDFLPAYLIELKLKGETSEKTEKSDFEEIKNLLKIHCESFENWRYIYEFGETGYSYEFDFKAMDAFYKALKDVLKSLLKGGQKTFGMERV